MISQSAHVSFRRAALFSTLVLVALGGILFAAAAVRSTFSSPLNYNEGWNSYHASSAAKGVPLYGSRPYYTAVNYPPLSFHLVALIGTAIGDFNLAGRWLSLAAILWISVCSGWIAYRSNRDGLTGALSGALTFTFLCSFAQPYLGMNDPQFLGQAFIMTGAAVYAGWPSSQRSLALCCTALCLGGFSKHNLLAFPVAITWDIARTSPKTLLRWAATATVILGALTIATLYMDGPYFVDHMLAPRQTDAARAVRGTVFFVELFAVPAAFVAYSRVALPRAVRFLWPALIIAFSLAVAFSAGSGVNLNVFCDAVIALACLSAIAIAGLASRVGCDIRRAFIAAGLLPLLFVSVPFLLSSPSIRYLSSSRRAELSARDRVFREDVKYLRSKPGPAICADLLYCYEAGKPLLFDAFIATELVSAGRGRATELIRDLEQHKYVVVQIGAPNELDRCVHCRECAAGGPLPAEALPALRSHYHVERRSRSHVYCVPNQ